MKPLCATLTFVLGLVLGPIIVLVAFFGVLLGVGGAMTVGEIQSSVSNSEFIEKDSPIYDDTLIQVLQQVLDDYQNFDQVSLKLLKDHYGFNIFEGYGGIDFTVKEFYDMPITDLVKDTSVIVRSITLNDISKVAGVDFSQYNLPILNQNLDNGISVAVDNIMRSLNGDLSIRAIKDSFGIDLGVSDNDMLAALQDIKLSDFGSMLDAIKVDTLLKADTDSYLPVGANNVYLACDEYQAVDADKLSNSAAAIGVETYIAGALDKDNDGVKESLDERELRYTLTTDADGNTQYVVDNSCYTDDYDATKTFYRHVQYKPYTGNASSSTQLYVRSYANRIATFSGKTYTLVEKGFTSLSDILYNTGDSDVTLATRVSGGKVTVDANVGYKTKDEETHADKYVHGEVYSIVDDPITKDSLLTEVEEDPQYVRVYAGTSTAILQTINYLSVSELRDAGDLLENLRVRDVIEITPTTAKILVTLQDKKITQLGEEINHLTLDDMIDIVYDNFGEPVEDGKYVLITDENGASYYTLYNPAVHSADLPRYNRTATEGASSAVLQRLSGAKLDSFSTSFSDLLLSDVMDIDADVYEQADYQFITEHPDFSYFRYDAETGVFMRADAEYVEAHKNTLPTGVYYVKHAGTSAAVLKKLALVKVDNMATSFDTVLKDMLLSEIMDINRYYAIELDPEGEVHHGDPNATFYMKWDDKTYENGKPAVFAYDADGKYIRRNFFYDSNLTEDDYTAKEEVKFDYVACGDTGTATSKLADYNVYYKAEGSDEYIFNLELATYLILGKKDVSKLYYRTDGTTYTGYKYTGEELYVEIQGKKVAYDSSKLSYSDLTVYKKRTVAEDETHETNYFFVPMDEPEYEYKAGDVRYAKVYCDDIFILDPDGEYVYVNGEYKQDADKAIEADQRFRKETGAVLQSAQAYLGNGSTCFEVTPVKSPHIRTKSTSVLQLLAGSTLDTINDTLDKAQIGDLMDITPGTIFDNEAIRTSTLKDLSQNIRKVLTDMTIGDLLSWSSITTIDPSVKDALKSCTVTSFFSSLTFDKETGTISVDMEKLFTYSAT